MRGKIKLVSFVLFAVLMLGFASTVNAQTPTFSVSSNPNEVVHYGVTEVMGRVQLSATNTGTTVGSQITITYQGIVIKNASSSPTAIGSVGAPFPDGTDAAGIRVQGAGVFDTAAGMTFTSVSNTGTGGQVVISIPAGIVATGDANADFFTIDGVRADVSTKALATDIQASLSSSPSTANTFINVSVVRVATINESLVISTTVASEAACITPTASPTLTIKEGSAGVFVQYVASAGATAAPVPPDARDAFGANGNTRINIVIGTLPTGVTITWPDSIDSDVLTNLGDGGQLSLISQSASGDAALYDYTTSLQAVSDANIETFVIDGTSGLVVDIDPDTVVPGGATVEVQLYPPDSTSATAVPRFNHPLINFPGDGVVQVSKCTTNLLFTFLTNATGVGFDSGMAIANTSMDPYGTAPQHGPITIYFYGTSAPTPLTTADVPAGSVWAASLSTIAPGFQGYAIAVAQFQYGHGYAFITGKYNSGSVYDVAEGYVAMVIPDPAFTGARNPGPPPQNKLALPPASGEQLGQ